VRPTIGEEFLRAYQATRKSRIEDRGSMFSWAILYPPFSILGLSHAPAS
jgi:hypothetical protein